MQPVFPGVPVRVRHGGLSAERREVLSHQLPAAIASLWRRRAWEVPQGSLDDFVTLGWMNWSRGALLLTPAGQIVYDRIVAQGATP